MQLLHRDTHLIGDARRTFRESPLAALGGLALAGALAGIGVRVLAPALRELPGLAWIIVGPVLASVGLFGLLVVPALVGGALSSLRRSNWVLKVAPDGVFLNLRSPRNAHFDGEDPTVAFLAFEELDGARRVREKNERRFGGESTIERRSWLELATTADTAPLAAAVETERAREAPERVFLGVRSRTKHHHVPVFVCAPGRVRVEWRRGLLRALAERVRIEPEVRADLDRTGDPDDRLRALVERGQRMAALELLHTELGLDLSAARERLAALERRSA